MKYSKILLEVAGTYGFFRPSDNKEILCNGPYNKEHAELGTSLYPEIKIKEFLRSKEIVT